MNNPRNPLNEIELDSTAPVLEEKLLAGKSGTSLPKVGGDATESDEYEGGRFFGGRFMRMLRRGSLGIVALVVVLATAWFNIPRRAIAWRIEREVAKQGYNLSLREVTGLRPWGQAKLEGIVWTLPGSTPKAPPDPVEFDSVKVNASLWKLLRKNNLDVDVLAELPQGQIQADVQQDQGYTVIKGKADKVPLQWVPKLQTTLGTPVEGLADLVYDLRVPKKDVDQISGTLEIRCSDCAVGDGASRVKLPGAKGMAAGGITIPRIHLGALDALIVFGDGKARVERFTSNGEDMKVVAQGEIELSKPIGNFRPDVEVKIFFDPKLLERADSFDLMVKSAVNAKLDGPDTGWLGYRWIYYPPKRRSVFLGAKSKTLQRLRKTMGNKSPLAANRNKAAPAGILKPGRPQNRAQNRGGIKPPPPPDVAKDAAAMKGLRGAATPQPKIADRSAQMRKQNERVEQEREERERKTKAEQMIREADERARKDAEERAERARKEAEEKAEREREKREQEEGDRENGNAEKVMADAAPADAEKMKKAGDESGEESEGKEGDGEDSSAGEKNEEDSSGKVVKKAAPADED